MTASSRRWRCGRRGGGACAWQVVDRRGEDAGLRIELHPFAGELFEHVVGDHDAGFVRHPEAAQLHCADDHRCGLAGADLVGEQHGGFGDDAGDGGELVLVRGEGDREAG